LRHGAGDAGSGGADDFGLGSAGEVGKTELTCGTHASAVDREKAPRTEGTSGITL
jgi:hypothetical protein